MGSESPQPTCPGPCNLDAMREDGWKRCVHSVPIPPASEQPQQAKFGLAAIEAERDTLANLLQDVLTDGVQDCADKDCQCSTARAKRTLGEMDT